MSDTELIKDLSGIPFKRLMYGEWVADECEECRTHENVGMYRDLSGRERKHIYLCATCKAKSPLRLKGWY